LSSKKRKSKAGYLHVMNHRRDRLLERRVHHLLSSVVCASMVEARAEPSRPYRWCGLTSEVPQSRFGGRRGRAAVRREPPLAREVRPSQGCKPTGHTERENGGRGGGACVRACLGCALQKRSVSSVRVRSVFCVRRVRRALCAYLTLCCVCTNVVLLGHPRQLRQQDFVAIHAMIRKKKQSLSLGGSNRGWWWVVGIQASRKTSVT